ncbi:unnamed protein product [Rotaria socialis]|uniref:TauD/TfdA-like domain-containing protein n=1 Tax=Rotaria socialis TaxID=392032 RepID=A0A821GZA7_9BILA|nr:unnamed protein product [Rotaria socialis]CAF4675153.1 unnamed protein product [Rotaria socialis]
MNFDSNNFDFDPNQIPDIEKKLQDDGYVRIQFFNEHLPNDKTIMKNMESVFIEIIEKLGGQCLDHNEKENSIVWHIQSMETCSDTKANALARSQTSDEFMFHTDCSYEINPAEYMALFVLEQDQFGGGQLEVIRLSDVLQLLSSETKEKLIKNKSKIRVPVEFQKLSNTDHINESILLDHDRIRYRYDILCEQNNEEFHELNRIINKVERYRPKLNKYTMIILNNQKYLHGRTKVLDNRRHLLRIRFNRPLPYNIFSIYEQEKLNSEYLTFSNELYDYFDIQHEYLYKILNLIVKQYSLPTSVGEEIRQTFQFNSKIHSILINLNIHRANFRIGTYRPDIIFADEHLFKMNGKYSFHPKICEINARFPFNGYFLSASLCSTNEQNRLSKRFSSLIETIIKSSKFDTTKPMYILKSKECGFDIHLFQQYWIKKYSQPCLFVDPKDLQIENKNLCNKNKTYFLEQFILELHQDEILELPDEILEFLIKNNQLNYMNDFRTIFILHDKRLFSLLSNRQFLYALLNSSQHIFSQFIPTTYVINNLPNYLRDSIICNKQDWCIKPNSAGKGENITIGVDVTLDEWSRQLLDSNHEQWIVQQYIKCVKYDSMNLSGMLFCFDDQCFNMGIIRISPNKIVNISHGGNYIRPYIHHEHIHSMNDKSILTKEKLHEQLVALKSIDNRWNQNVYVSSSGGSGGKSLFFATDIKQNQLQRQILVDMMLEQNIISHNDVCLNLFQSNNIYRSFEIFNDFCTMANCTTLPMSASATDADILKVIEYFKPNILMGSPYRLMQFAFFMEKQIEKKINFEKIYFACESLDEIKQRYFERIFHCSIFIGFYGSAEAGVFACQSPKYSATKIFLYPKELVHIEIINSKIIVTNLIRKRNQLIRFDSGDLGRLISNNENDKYGLLEVFYSQRLIMIGDDTLSISDIEEIMKQIDLIEWQLVIDYVSHTENNQILFLFRYVKFEFMSIDTVEKTIRNDLQKCFDIALSKISEQLILQFESIEFNGLTRDKTSNKLLKIIDQRS